MCDRTRTPELLAARRRLLEMRAFGICTPLERAEMVALTQRIAQLQFVRARREQWVLSVV